MSSSRDSYIMAAIAVGLITAYFFGVYRPQQRGLEKVRVAAAELSAQLEQRNQEIASSSTTQNELVRLQDELARYDEKLPPESEVSEFLEQMSTIATGVNVTDQNIILLDLEEYPNLAVQPILVTFTGGFEEAFSFLSHLEKLPRVARIRELRIEPAEGFDPVSVFQAQTGRYGSVKPIIELKVELKVQIFYQRT